MGIALSLVAVWWPIAGLVAWVLALRARAIEADAERAHFVTAAHVQRLKLAQDVEDDLRAKLKHMDDRLQRMESGAALSRR